ncbi:conserved hypothetical protein [Culex quinquefasciatus]|uniref:Uncharacterized protein n=1 Tax=Culex quinquefasciatus TaxID=7176 RepID=B0WU44_CULQU|nr:conserved hypothetical protein [Culex quinquefasciatus]|eukprot:XP_001857730.1 conserved hypothetical protein [Culex quinquefasciatus]
MRTSGQRRPGNDNDDDDDLFRAHLRELQANLRNHLGLILAGGLKFIMDAMIEFSN